jgi:DNA gyrase inhibitor GyrI
MRGGIDQMTTEDGFQSDRPPIFLSGRAEEAGQPDIGKGWDVATISSRILKASILAVVVTGIGIAVLSVGNPVMLVANVTDWWVDKPALQPEADPAASTSQTIAGAQDAPTTTTDAPQREEIAAVVEPAEPSQAEAAVQRQAEVGQRQAENSQPITAESKPVVTEELFKQFQAWAAEEETRKQAGSAQAAPVRVAQDVPAQARPAKKHRRVHSVQNARAEIRPQRHHRARVREQQLDAREQVPPVADPRAPDPSVQNAQPPSFLQSLGFRN